MNVVTCLALQYRRCLICTTLASVLTDHFQTYLHFRILYKVRGYACCLDILLSLILVTVLYCHFSFCSVVYVGGDLCARRLQMLTDCFALSIV